MNIKKNKSNIQKSLYTKDFWMLFFVIFIPFTVVFGLILFMFYRDQVNSQINILCQKEFANIEIYKNSLQADIDSVLSDLKYLADQPALKAYINGDDQNKMILEQDYLVFSREKNIYDQVRFISSRGMEMIRINNNNGVPTIVAPGDLQDKKDRYYFSDTFKMEAKQIFFSPLDLNIEKGKIEIPLKPMIRVGMVLTDKTGKKKGIILLNVLAGKFLGHIQKIGKYSIGSEMLINNEGYWLSGPDDVVKYGFMFKDRQQDSFAVSYPEEWSSIQSDKIGQMITENGLFTYSTLFPLINNKEQITSAGQYYWYFVSKVSPEDLAVISGTEYSEFTLAYVIIILLLFALSMIRARSKIVQQRSNDTILQKNQILMENQRRLESSKREILLNNQKLTETLEELEKAMAEIHTLKGILPICSYCKEIRNDEGYWVKLENYIQDHSDAEFSHSICDSCLEKHIPEETDKESK